MSRALDCDGELLQRLRSVIEIARQKGVVPLSGIPRSGRYRV
jgi:hypothetical protein